MSSTQLSFNGHADDGTAPNALDLAAPEPRSLWQALWAWTERPDSAALHGLVSGVLWFFVGASLGMLMSQELVQPDFLQGISWLSFGRLRAAHLNVVLFGFLSTAFYGAWYFIVPRLCRVPLQSERAANLLLFVWNIVVTLGMVSLLLGHTSGHEYGELEWFIAYPVEAALIFNAAIIYATIAARKERSLYVSLWYIGGAVIWMCLVFVIGHIMWHPVATPVMVDGHQVVQNAQSLMGLNDAVWMWFYGHNVFGLYVTPGGLAIVYYLVPKITKRPLYSHLMSLIGFWSLALFYTNTGQHHMLQSPIPNWLKVLSIIGSIAMIVPVFTFNTNLFMTMRGMWGRMIQNIPLRFLLTGAFFYLAVSFQGSVQSLMSVNRFEHFTQWVVAHAHLALLGAFGFIACGATLHIVPQIVRKQLWSPKLADAQFWLMFIGINGYFWAITGAGLAQSSAWISTGEQVVKMYPVVKPYFAMRSWFGGLIWLGVVAQIVNVVMTIRQPAFDAAARRRRVIANLEDEAPELSHEGSVALAD